MLGSGNREKLISAVERPSLGQWTNILRENLKQKWSSDFPLGVAIAQFWQMSLSDSPRRLIDVVNGAGLSWPDKIPRSHLGWLNWLVWLRNLTKGHGGVEEKACLPIWHEFHATLLGAVTELSPLTLHSTLATEDALGVSVALRGWLRGPFRSSTIDLEPESLSSRNDHCAFIYNGTRTDLSPFVICEGNVCLSWNSGDSHQVEYTDYATGRLLRRNPPHDTHRKTSAVSQRVMTND